MGSDIVFFGGNRDGDGDGDGDGDEEGGREDATWKERNARVRVRVRFGYVGFMFKEN